MENKKNDIKPAAHPESKKRSAPVLDNHLKTLREKGISAISGLSKSDMISIANWAREVFNEYDAVLKSLPSKIKSIADLPFPKEDIKMAIKILLLTHVSKGSDDMVSRLKERYVRLSAFQDIGQEDQEILIRESREINNKKESTGGSTFTTYNRYIDLIVAEQNVLVEDINTFIEDLPYVA